MNIDYETIRVNLNYEIKNRTSSSDFVVESIIVMFWQKIVELDRELGLLPFEGSLKQFLELTKMTQTEFARLYELWGKNDRIDTKRDDFIEKIINDARERAKVFTLINEIITRIPSKNVPKSMPLTEPALYKGKDFEKIAASPPMLSSLEAQLKPEKWKNTNGLATYSYKATKEGNKKKIEHYIRDWGAQETRAIPLQNAIAIIEKFGLNTAKLHLIFSIYACRSNEPWQANVEIKGSDLIEHLNLPRNMSFSEKLQEIVKCSWALSSLMFALSWEVEGSSKKHKKSYVEQISPLWAVKGVEYYYKEDDRVNPYDCVISLTPGKWAKHFLNNDAQSTYEYSWLFSGIASLDNYHHEIALRIALAQVVQWYRNKPLSIRVWLLEAGVDPVELEEIGKDRRRCKELKTLWDTNVIPTLQKLGFKLEYDANTYHDYLLFSYQGKLPRGYFPQWLEAKLAIIRPEPPKQMLKTVETVIKHSSETAPKPPKPVKNLEDSSLKNLPDLIDLRISAGISQISLSLALGKAKNYIARVEKNQIKLTPKLIQAIEEALNKLK